MECVSAEHSVSPRKISLQNFPLAKKRATTTPDITPSFKLPHLALVGQEIKTDNELAITDISERVPHIIEWLSFCDYLSLVEPSEKALLDGGNNSTLIASTENILARTFTKFNKLIKDSWIGERTKLHEFGIKHHNVCEENVNISSTLSLEFLENTDYGGNEERGLRLVDNCMCTYSLIDITSVNRHLGAYIAWVAEKLVHMAGHAVGEIIMCESYYFGEGGEIIESLDAKTRNKLKSVLTEAIQTDIFSKKKKSKKLIKKLNKLLDLDKNELFRHDNCFGDLESEVNYMQTALTFFERRDTLQSYLNCNVKTLRKMATRQTKGRNKGEKKLLSLVNTILDSVITPLENEVIASSFSSGSDENFFDSHHVYLTPIEDLQESFGNHFECQAQSGEIPAYYIDVKEHESVVNDLMNYQKGIYCMLVLEEFTNEAIKK